jgi:hypothetical protein
VKNSLFSVANDHLSRLDAGEAVALITKLLWAEATRLGIPITSIQISADINTPDDGVDAKVFGHNVVGDLIRAGHTAYQIKSGDSFKPQQEATIRKELFGEGSPSKDHLKRRIRECLDEGGIYVLVCTGIDSVDLTIAEGHLRNFFIKCDYANPRVEVWVQNQLCGFLTKYPSIALNVNEHEAGVLRSHKGWAGDAEMEMPFKPGAKQIELIANLRVALRKSENAVHVHIRGEAGNGKTRLVLEATRHQDLQPLVLYTSTPAEILNSEFMATLTREDNYFAVILVVDECGAEYRTQIWNRLKSRGQRVKLITIFNEHEDASGVSFFDAPLLERENIIQIIESYDIAKDQAERFASFCSGSPRVAHVVGVNLKKNPEDLLKSPDTANIWERFVIGIDDRNSSIVSDRLTVLRHIALFKRFGYGDPVAAEARSISAMIEKGYPHITWPRFQEIISGLRKQKILQGETTLYITPKLLHIWLWISWWNFYGTGFDLEEFVNKFEKTLLPWFLEMFMYAEQSQVAQEVVRKLLGSTGLFQNSQFLKTKLGGDFFLALTDVNPEQALVCLQGTIGSWSYDQLLEFRQGRRGVIWALEKIAVWKDLFIGASKLLLKLAEAENETWSNNATGMFAELFSPGYGELAPTEASPQERFHVLEEALTSQSEITREIALKACDSALEAQHFSRMQGAEHQGFKPKPKLWTPKTYGEIWDAYRRVWNLLRKQLPVLPTNQRAQAVKILFDNGIPITSATNLGLLVLETWREIFDKGWITKGEILDCLVSLLRFHRKGLNPEVSEALERFRDELVGKDFSSILKRYVAMNLLEDQFDENDQPTDSRNKQIHALAEQCVSQPDLLGPELAWLVTAEAKNGYQFGYELGKLDRGQNFLKIIVEEQQKSTVKNTVFFLSGYMRAIFESGQETWERLLDEFATSDQMRIHIAELTWRSGMTDRAALRVLKLAWAGQMDVTRFGIFCSGNVIKDLSEDAFKQWAEFLVKQSDSVGVRILLNLMLTYYGHGNAGRTLPADLALRALSHETLFQKNGQFHAMERFYWTEVGQLFVSNYPKESLLLAKRIIDHFGVEGTIVGRSHSNAHKVLMEITKNCPCEVWELVAERLSPPADSRAFHLASWLHGDRYSPGGETGVLPLMPLEQIWKWVDANREKRARYLASFVPKQLFRSNERPCLAREVLIRYGADSGVRNNLMANFSTESWSGSRSLHYQEKKHRLLDFKKEESDANVKLWIDEYVEDLQLSIDAAKVREEREAF